MAVCGQRGSLSSAARQRRAIRITQRSVNGIWHRVELAGYLMVAEPNYSITQLVEKGRSQSIVMLRVGLGVLIAINFDHQALPSAAKICDIRSNRVLAPKFESRETPTPQLHPELAFNRRSLDTKPPAAVA